MTANPNLATEPAEASYTSAQVTAATTQKELPRIPVSECTLMQLPSKPFGTSAMIPKVAVQELVKDDVLEHLENKTFAFKQGLAPDPCIQTLLAAIPVSVNRRTLIMKHYPEYQHLVVQNDDTSGIASSNAQLDASADRPSSVTHPVSHMQSLTDLRAWLQTVS